MLQFSDSLDGDLVNYTRELAVSEFNKRLKNRADSDYKIVFDYLYSGIGQSVKYLLKGITELGCSIYEDKTNRTVALYQACWKGKKSNLQKLLLQFFLCLCSKQKESIEMVKFGSLF